MNALISRAWGWLLGVGVVALSLLGLYAKGRSDGNAAAAKARMQDDLARQRAALDQIGEAHDTRQAVDKELRKTPPEERRENLVNRWSKPR